MARKGMGKSMGNRECDWIRARLPLWVNDGAGNGRQSAHCDGGDLSSRDHRHIERHLANCTTCRHYRASLDQALSALAIAATQLPVLPESPSLWPSLERRIASREAIDVSRGQKAASGLSDRSVRPWGDLDAVRPLRQAWTHDTIHEALAGRKPRKAESKRTSGLIWKISAAAAVLVALIGVSIARQLWNSAQATILANSTPLADPVRLPTVADLPPLEISERDNDEVAANQLAEAEPPRPAETPAPGLDAAAATKSPLHTRFGFDLERGTPMPPDSREAKPVY